MDKLVCLRCFNEFAPFDLWFKCLNHAKTLLFPWRGEKKKRPPSSAACPNGGHLSGIRICPKCKHDLPYYIGRTPLKVVGITGCSGVGKTVYLWSLLYELRGRLAREENPYATAMFEDDHSFAIYQEYCTSILGRQELPEATRAIEQLGGDLPPIVVRLLLRQGVRNLILYDPAGEIIENRDKLEFLGYLQHYAAIIFLIEPPDPEGGHVDQIRATSALTNVANCLRKKLKLSEGTIIPKALAVVLTKGDQGVFENDPPSKITPGHGRGQEIWNDWRNADREGINRSSEECKQVLRKLGFNELVNAAESNFRTQAFFAISSLGDSLQDGSLNLPVTPIGVEAPLFWCLRQVE